MDNPVKKQQEPLTQKFIVDGKTFVYNIDILSAERLFTAKTLFILSQKMEMNIPSNMDELRMVVNRKTESYAYATILVEATVDENGKITGYIDDFDTFAMDTLDVMKKIKTREEIIKLVECKNDFFHHTGLSLIELLQQFPDIIKQLESVKDKKMLAQVLASVLPQNAGGKCLDAPAKTATSTIVKHIKKS